MGLGAAPGLRRGGPSVCRRCCCAGSRRGGMVTRFIGKSKRPCVPSVGASSCPPKVHCLCPLVAACGGGVGVDGLRAAVSCTG